MYGMFVRELRGGVPYAYALALGFKKIETRSRNMLSALVGHRVAIIKTESGKSPVIIGYVTITGSDFCKTEDFQKFYNQHFVPPGSQFDARGKGKWFYFCENAETCRHYPLPANAVRHGRSWCEF